MAVSITNFNQLAREQQMRMQERMHSLCPQTANLSEQLILRPVSPDQIPLNQNSGLSISDQQMIGADRINAQNSQALSAVLGQACAQEMLSGEQATLPPFLAEKR